MTEAPHGIATAGWCTGTAEGMAAGTGPEVRTNVNGASSHLLAGKKQDWLYGHGRACHQAYG